MPLKLRLALPIEEGIMFSGFLPEAEADWLHSVLREGKYRVSVYLSDRSQQSPNVADAPEDPTELEKCMTLLCSSVAVEIEARQVDRDVVNALQADQPTEKTDAFAREVFEVVLEVHNGLVSYFRNIAKQYWLKPLDPDPGKYRQFIRRKWGLSWLDSADEWRRFRFTPAVTGHLTVRTLERGVDRDRWRKVGPFIERGARAPMPDVLIANSLQHLSERNGRLAVVEAVTALEYTVRHFLGGVILAIPGAPQVEEAMLDKIIERAGLRLVTQVGLKIVATPLGLDPTDIELVIEAVEKRNSILHGPQREISISLAKSHVAAIRRVIDTLDSWTESGGG